MHGLAVGDDPDVAGTFEGRIGASPVYNVSVPVMGRDFWLLELASLGTPTTPIH